MKKISESNFNGLWSGVLLDELQRHGIKNIFLCPGLRNTPLIAAAIKNNEFNIYNGFDERSQSFRALGAAKESRRPSVLICTSGTALANFFPAVIEAYQSETPLIIISADRPKELILSGDNQSCQQENLYGTYSLKNLNLPCPNPNLNLTQLRRSISQLMGKKGPVHINIPFREPLFEGEVPTFEKNLPKELKQGKNYQPLDLDFGKFKKPLLVLGELDRQLNIDLNIPYFCDVTSKTDSFLPSFESLYTRQYLESYKPDIIIHLGKRCTSKHYYSWLKQNPTYSIQVCDSKRQSDPSNSFDEVYYSNNYEKVLELLKDYQTALSNKFFPELHQSFDQYSIAKNMLENCSQEENFVIGNSSVIRSFDMLQNRFDSSYFNRGTSGIEGLIAFSMGIAESSNKKTNLILGDVSFIHDMGSLSMLADFNQILHIYLWNNGGGGIFSGLPIASEKEVLTKISTPHNFHFSRLAQQFSLEYHEFSSSIDWKEIDQSKTSLIELNIKIDSHNKVQQYLKNYEYQ